jgi:hypothetical protein
MLWLQGLFGTLATSTLRAHSHSQRLRSSRACAIGSAMFIAWVSTTAVACAATLGLVARSTTKGPLLLKFMHLALR